MIPRLILCLLLLLPITSLKLHAQGENNIWCFGYGSGLDFNTPVPTPFPNNIFTGEACATVSDAAGNLLFYSNAETVWDRNHNIMPNGSGLAVAGANSTMQGVVAVQSFSNPDRYFLFTLEQTTGFGRLFYSVIDMTLNGGLGDVITGQKNIQIDSNLTEKMTVAKGDGCYNWVIVHPNDTPPMFHAFKVDYSGVNTTPVVSYSGFSYTHWGYVTGEIKMSPNNDYIAVGNDHVPEVLEIHSFNSATGVFSNAIDLDTLHCYGLSYSPDGGKLYVAQYFPTSQLYQFDMTLLPNVQAVKNSRTLISNDLLQGMLIGRDDKIYIAASSGISVINNPNLAGVACNYVSNQINNAGAPYELGNVFIPPDTNQIGNYSHDTSLCVFINSITLSAPAGYISYLWNDGATTQSHVFSTSGTRWVISSSTCGVRTDTFHLNIVQVDTEINVTDTSVCFVNNIPILTAAAGYSNYLWSDGHNTQQDTIGSAGTKWVRINDTASCKILIDTFKVHAYMDTVKTSTDTSHCVAYSPIPITAPGGYTSYLWSDGITVQTDTFFSTTTKWVTAQNGCHLLIDTIHFTATTIPPDSVSVNGIDTMICFEMGAINVSAPAGYTYYLWSDGTTTQANTFNGPATKWVYAQKFCYLLIDTFAVQALGTDTSMSSTDTIICFSNTATVQAASGYLSYLWSDGTNGQQDTFTSDGTKYVQMHKACAERIDTFHVQFVNDLSVSLGNDTALCKGEVIRLDATSSHAGATYLWQDNSTAATYTVTTGGDYFVTMSLGSCSVSDTIRVHQKVINVNLGKGNIPCGQTEILLDAGVDSASYIWQDGSTNRTFKAVKEGSYQVKVTQGTCNATASVTVKFDGCPCNVILPTAFSPNNDDKNDKFGATISCDILSSKMIIYNRWGNQVFYSEHINDKWDGTYKNIALDGDVFGYYLEFKDAENKTYYYKGTVTLVR